ncbi:hypothetical protein BJV78DRAFT_1205792 [Lactifluus subvellereus]|nr:hypothetical protein BJV78DRAFT_1205792 [Lactifluus subvellereus]
MKISSSPVESSRPSSTRLGRRHWSCSSRDSSQVWAWKWDSQEDSEFGNYFSVPLHLLYKPIRPVLDDFVPDQPLKNCAPFVLAYSAYHPLHQLHDVPLHLSYPSTPTPACELPRHLRNLLHRLNLPPQYPSLGPIYL